MARKRSLRRRRRGPAGGGDGGAGGVAAFAGRRGAGGSGGKAGPGALGLVAQERGWSGSGGSVVEMVFRAHELGGAKAGREHAGCPGGTPDAVEGGSRSTEARESSIGAPCLRRPPRQATSRPPRRRRRSRAAQWTRSRRARWRANRPNRAPSIARSASSWGSTPRRPTSTSVTRSCCASCGSSRRRGTGWC